LLLVKASAKDDRIPHADPTGVSDQFNSQTSRMWIAEIFGSRQGEGRLAGTDSAFIRFSGCNLRCWFCDTPYTSWHPEGEHLDVSEVLDRVQRCRADHVVITGGEPMLTPHLVELCRVLRRQCHHITIETAGTLFRQVDCDLMSISPKLSNSTPDSHQQPAWAARHEARRNRPDVIRRLSESYDYQVKFVVDKPDDLREIDDYLAQFTVMTADKIWLMPQGIDQAELESRESWLRPHCLKRGFHLCSRWQIRWYGNRRGT
jgi:7-carboxy-7-deazaguanine synthase